MLPPGNGEKKTFRDAYFVRTEGAFEGNTRSSILNRQSTTHTFSTQLTIHCGSKNGAKFGSHIKFQV